MTLARPAAFPSPGRDAAGSIVQAEQGPVGVTVTPDAIDPATGQVKLGEFNDRGRVPDATLLAGQPGGNKARDTPPKPKR